MTCNYVTDSKIQIVDSFFHHMIGVQSLYKAHYLAYCMYVCMHVCTRVCRPSDQQILIF
jgi:hypothetical protein